MTETHPPIESVLAPLFTDRVILLDELHARELIVRAKTFTPAKAQGTTSPGVDRGVTQQGNIARIPIVGVLTKYPSPDPRIDQWFGLCPCYSVIQHLESAVNDASIERIALDADSPGGFVNGSVELADAVAAANRIKPVDCYVSGMCCSGMYWIGSQCNSIIARPEALVGNIGAYSVLVDQSKFFDDLGFSFTLVASGRFKGLGADGKVTQDLIDETRGIINGTYQQFVEAVARGRGLDLELVKTLADGRTFLGPQAKSLKLVDGLASSFDAAIQLVTNGATAPGESAMAGKPTATAGAAPAEKPHGTSSVGVQAADNKEPVDQPADPGGGGGGTGNEKARKAFDKAADSAGKHREHVRAALDAHTEMTDEADAETEASAKRAIASMRATAAEAQRCADMIEDDYGDDDDDDADQTDPQKQENAPASAKAHGPSSAAIYSKADFVKAFGEDKGLVYFGKDLSFADATAQHVQHLTATHAAEKAALEGQVTALKSENESLKTRLGLMSRGNEPASFAIGSEDGKSNGGAGASPDAVRTTNQALEQWARSLVLPKSN